METFIQRYSERRKEFLEGKRELFKAPRCMHKHRTPLKSQEAMTYDLVLAEEAVCRYCFAKQHIRVVDFNEPFKIPREGDNLLCYYREHYSPSSCNTLVYRGYDKYDEPMNRTIVFSHQYNRLFVQRVLAAWCCGYNYNMFAEYMKPVNWMKSPEEYFTQLVILLATKPRFLLGLGKLSDFGLSELPTYYTTKGATKNVQESIKLKSRDGIGLEGVSMPKEPFHLKHLKLMRARAVYEIAKERIIVGDHISFRLLAYKYDCFDLYWLLTEFLIQEPSMLSISPFFIGLVRTLILPSEYESYVKMIKSPFKYKVEDVLCGKHLLLKARELAYAFVEML